jgi:hypothetical protein
MAKPDPNSDDREPDESPGVPGFRSWRAVYVFVFAAFVLGVVALGAFSRFYT